MLCANRLFLSHFVDHFAYRIVRVGETYALRERSEPYGRELALEKQALSPENVIG